MSADPQALKDEGNKLFQAGEYLKSAAVYTQAIKLDSGNAVLYSNRSAALLKLKKVTKAMEDADKCIQLRPDWEKGYFRKGAILEDQGSLAEALEVYQTALKLVPDSKELSQKIRTLSKLVNKSKSGGAAQEKTAPAPAVSEPTGPAAASDATPESAESVVYEDMGSEEVAKFTADFLGVLAEEVHENGTAFEPMVHFLPGRHAEVINEEMQHVKGLGAFESPETLAGFVGFLRQTAQQLDAEAVLTLVPKGKIGYPQVWLKPKWPGGSSDGVLAQLESRQVKRCWFIPVNGNKPGTPTSISSDSFGVLPPVLRT